MNFRNLLFSGILSLFVSTQISAQQNVAEPPDFSNSPPGTNTGMVVGNNTFSGTLNSPGDGADYYEFTVYPGLEIISASYVMSGSWGGWNIGTTYGGGASSVNNPNSGPLPSAGQPYPIPPGTYYGFATGTTFGSPTPWSMTYVVTGTPTCTNPTLSTSVTNESCPGANNGAINLTASGGNPPFSYSWTGPGGYTANTEDISGLVPGTYNVTVSGSGCSASTSVSVGTDPDITPPNAVCNDIQVFLDGSGNVSINPFDVDGGSTDNCTIVDRTVTPNSLGCKEVSVEIIELSLQGVQPINVGNNGANQWLMAMGLSPQNDGLINGIRIEVGNVLIPGDLQIEIGQGNDPNTGPILETEVIALGLSSIGPIDIGFSNPPIVLAGNPIFIRFQSQNGLFDLLMNPLDPYPLGGLFAGFGPLGPPPPVNPVPGADLGLELFLQTLTPVELKVTDQSGNTAACKALVRVDDTIPPIAICNDLVIQLDTAGGAKIKPQDVDLGSFDECTIVERLVFPDSFTCNEVSVEIIELSLTGASPIQVGTSGGTQWLMAMGLSPQNTGEITGIRIEVSTVLVPGDIEILIGQGNDPNTGPILETEIIALGLSSIGPVDIAFSNPPIVLAGDPVFIRLESQNGLFDLLVDPLDPYPLGGLFTGNGPLGPPPPLNPVPNTDLSLELFIQTLTEVTLTVADQSGNTASCLSLIRVDDTIPPIAICQDLVIQLDTAGKAKIKPEDVDLGSFDDCTIVERLVEPESFTCNEVSVEIIELSLVGTQPINVGINGGTQWMVAMGLSPQNTGEITGIRIEVGNVFVPGDLEVKVGRGKDPDTGPILETKVTPLDSTGPLDIWFFNPPIVFPGDSIFMRFESQNGLFDLLLDPLDPYPLGGLFGGNGPLGPPPVLFPIPGADLGLELFLQALTPVSLIVTDQSGNTASCQSLIRIEDTIPPIAICNDLLINLDSSGKAKIMPDDIDFGSADNCDVIVKRVVPDSFTCAEVPIEIIELSLTSVSPIQVGTNGGTQWLVAMGLTPQNNGELTSLTINVGNVVIPGDLEVKVGKGNDPNTGPIIEIEIISLGLTSIGPIDITFTTPPILFAGDPYFLLFESQNGFLDLLFDPLDPYPLGGLFGGNGPLGPPPLVLPVPGGDLGLELHLQSFTLAKLIVTDPSGNSDSCQSIITVRDPIKPYVTKHPYPTFCLDSIGQVVIHPNDLIDSIWDNCGIDTTELDRILLDCNDFGTVFVTLTVTDQSGNTSTCTGPIGVFDKIKPSAACHDTILYLDSNGNASLHTIDLEWGSWDNCSYGVINTLHQFNWSHLGQNTVIVTVFDPQYNLDTCHSTVTVIDSLNPQIFCTDTMVSSDPGLCSAVVTWTVPTASAGAVVSQFGGPFNGSTLPVGVTTVSYKATLPSGNSSSCSLIVTVKDVEPPVISCPNNVVRRVGPRKSGRIVNYQMPTATDNCGIASIAHVSGGTSGSFFPIGVTVIVWKATDINGNMTTCSFTVTVNVIAPLAMEDNIMENGETKGSDANNAGLDLKINSQDVNYGNIEMLIYPNPAQGSFTIEVERLGYVGKMSIEIFDLLGRRVYSVSDGFDNLYQKQLNLLDYSSGQHMVHFRIDDVLLTRKLLIIR